AEAAGNPPIAPDSPHLEAEIGLEDDVESERQQDDGDDDQEHPVIGELQEADDPHATIEDVRYLRLLQLRPEDELRYDLKNDADAPRGQQRLQRPVVDPSDDRSLDEQADQPDDDEGERNGEEQRIGEGRADDVFAQQVAAIGADHDELAMRHVDDAADPEDDGETGGGDHQDGHDAEAGQELHEDLVLEGNHARPLLITTAKAAAR